MGLSSQQRRAAKQQRRAKRHRRRQETAPNYGARNDGARNDGATGGWGAPWWAGPDAQGLAELLVSDLVAGLSGARATAAEWAADVLRRRLGQAPEALRRRAVATTLAQAVKAAVHSGWDPSDLAELVRRRLGESVVPGLAALLAERPIPQGSEGIAWRDDLRRLGVQDGSGLLTDDRLPDALALAALLRTAGGLHVRAAVPRPRAASGVSDHQAGMLAKVRALLAKAESTEHDAEAEAFLAKAQELISKHALERLLATQERDDSDGVIARRVWLDPPYLAAKASLVHVVADANRCQAVLVERLEFAVVFGGQADLDAVELLVTSLLVQANQSMLRHGQQIDRRGVSRTRSFRQSFLHAFAARIGQRLREATEEAVRDSGQEGRLLPVLRDQEQRVKDSVVAAFPDLVRKETSLSNAYGWAAGRAAADQAQLDVSRRLAPSTP